MLGSGLGMPRTAGELSVTQNSTSQTIVLAPAGAPVSQLYRHGSYMLALAETNSTEEFLGKVKDLKAS